MDLMLHSLDLEHLRPEGTLDLRDAAIPICGNDGQGFDPGANCADAGALRFGCNPPLKRIVKTLISRSVAKTLCFRLTLFVSGDSRFDIPGYNIDGYSEPDTNAELVVI